VPALPHHYEDPATAADYRRRFSKSWTRRLSNALELRMLCRALDRAGASEHMLDVPCGAGRLAPALARRTRSLTCVDAARAMLEEARRLTGATATFVRASALELPFREKAFDVTVCWRLIHHFAEPEDRRRLLLELRRVTSRAFVLSFWDAGTARARRIRRRANARSGRSAIARGTLVRELESCGLVAERFYRLFGPFSPLAAVLVSVR